MFECGSNYVCEKSVPTAEQPTPSCDFKSGKIILQQPVEREQMHKLLATGKTDLLDKFVSMRTRRAVQGLPGLGQGSGQGELRVRAARQQVPAAQGRAGQGRARPAAKTTPAAKKAAGQEGAAAKKAPPRRRPPRRRRRARPAPGLKPSAALAAVIGAEPVARTEVIKKLWDYIKANGLQDAHEQARHQRRRQAAAGVRQGQVTMFELAGIVGKHLS